MLSTRKLTVFMLLFLMADSSLLRVAFRQIPEVDEQVEVKKKSILVGMSETTEEVCATVIYHDHEPLHGHLVNGSRVEILQSEDHKFVRTYVRCSGEDRPACHGVKDDLYISECVTVYENRNTMIRLVNSGGPFELGTIRVPILCECRLRRQYGKFEHPETF